MAELAGPRAPQNSHPWRWALVFAVLGLAAGCDVQRDDTGLRLCSDEPEEGALEFTLAKEWARGGIGDDQLSLTGVSWLVPNSRGGASFVERTSQVVTLDAAGNVESKIGASGQGPGEWPAGTAPSIRWFGDTLVVVDIHNRRTHRFARSGELLGVSRVGRELEEPVVPLETLSGQAFIGTTSLNPGAALVFWREGQTQYDSLSIYMGGRVYRARLPDGRIVSRSRPFSYGPLHRVHPIGTSFLIVDMNMNMDSGTIGYTLRHFNPDGTAGWEKDVCLLAVPISSEERHDSIRRHASAITERGTLSTGAVEAILAEAMALPEMRPPVTKVLISSGGDVWIRREEGDGDSVAWEVRGDTGSLLGFLRVPAGLNLMAVDDDIVWAVHRDQWDVPVITRFQLGRNTRSDDTDRLEVRSSTEPTGPQAPMSIASPHRPRR